MIRSILISIAILGFFSTAFGGEPVSPPDTTKPHQFLANVGEEVQMRMGDTHLTCVVLNN